MLFSEEDFHQKFKFGFKYSEFMGDEALFKFKQAIISGLWWTRQWSILLSSATIGEYTKFNSTLMVLV